MPGSTYLELVNDVLVMIGETPLTEDNFNATRSIHTTTKRAVANTVSRINKNPFEWPFDAVDTLITLIPDDPFYTLPDDFKSYVDASFIVDPGTTGATFKIQPLYKIQRDQYFQDRLPLDATTTTLRGIPRYFADLGNGEIALSPIPDQAYNLSYQYYKHVPELVNHDDVCNIPSEYNYVIHLGALYWMRLFKQDMDGAAAAKVDFEEALKNMRTLLVNNNYEYVRGSMSNMGGTIMAKGYRRP